MQMARPFDNSISGVIRYLGAKKDTENGQIEVDTIVKALEEKMNGKTTVDPGTVLVTTSGAMLETHKVKRIFHAAANYGQVGQGYIPIDYVARCVVNALKVSPEDCKPGELRSVLFPLMATRSRRGAVLEERVKPLLNAAIEYLVRNPGSTFRKVYFLTYTDKELEVCQDLLRADSRLDPLSLTQPASEGLASETPVSKKSASGQKSVAGSEAKTAARTPPSESAPSNGAT